MAEDLENMWREINDDCFGGHLKPLSAIDWDETTGPKGFAARGHYYRESKRIVIDQRLEFDTAAAQRDGTPEKLKYEIVYRLLLHEMIHQAIHQNKSPNPGGHGEEFVEEATRIAGQLGADAPTTAESARLWPPVEDLLVRLDDIEASDTVDDDRATELVDHRRGSSWRRLRAAFQRFWRWFA